MSTPKRIVLPKIEDRRGNLSVIEEDSLPFKFKRVYYLYDVPSGASRGGHAHCKQSALLIALSGSFDVKIKNGISVEIFTLNKPNEGLLIPNGYWRELDNFSSGGICLVLASGAFEEEDYIRDYKEYLKFKRS
ncbi:sugar 3,4-ketoisomerase [Leeuwenhoekiella aequorea]|uniref:WxcM-like protein n=1 Tax=Leeuwenhoekiella aequorea TaxID=283736 RepID=A0A4Q0P7R1_9FLAO|nr:FdtA/QdtA family cupin domain-containing protein [Leeuwenhoekiella aequorea]RXG22515.1 WxcM-like protein [Leeuwenhoekiella aequorea]